MWKERGKEGRKGGKERGKKRSTPFSFSHRLV